jgi:phage terminase small subunit
MLNMAGLTEQQTKFVEHLVSSGCTPSEAARHAGFASPPQEAYRLMQKPHVMAAIRHLRERLISGHAANVALTTLVEIMRDKQAPASARVSAARTAFEAAGHFDKTDRDAAGNMAEMSAGELEGVVARLDAQLAKRVGAVH